MKKNLFLLLIFVFQLTCSYGQLALYNTRTLYDTFENPSQKAYYADSSKKFAFNFLIPTISFNATVTGEAQTPIKRLLYKNILDAGGLTLGEQKYNKLAVTENSYIAMFRIFKSVKFHKEMGFSWQIRSDTYSEVTNETIAIFKNYKSFSQASYTDPFNDNGYSLNYHQFSFTYREDYNKRLGLGVKLSYLSGIVNAKLNINSSFLGLQKAQDAYILALQGKVRSNISFNEDLQSNVLMPGFKNPGLAFSLSANYKMKGGWYILGNLKDLGFIRWKDSYTYSIDNNISITTASSSNAATRLSNEIKREFDGDSAGGAYTTLINGKAEFLINKDFGAYQPNLLLSKNLFYKGGDIALVNRVRHRVMNFSLSTAYNLNNYFQVGGQFMIKSPNTEFFIGSDQLFKSYYAAKGIYTKSENIGKGNTAAGIYLGFGLKFGGSMERQQNATTIPGIESVIKPGFFRRLFSKKARSEK